MDILPIVPPDRIDATWLAAALHGAGVGNGTTLRGFTAIPVGNGLVGSSIRFALDWADPAAGPPSVVGKFPADDATSRGTAFALRLYLREVNFYRVIARRVAIHTPRVLASSFNHATHDFFLIFEDLSPARPGDQLTGCGPEDAAIAMREIAGLHAPFWNSPALATFDWLGLPEPAAEAITAAIPAVHATFRERYEGNLEPEIMAAVDRTAALGAVLMRDRTNPPTVRHGDYRLDNLLFDVGGGRAPQATLDWQTTDIGCGVLDVSYFLGASLPSALRRVHERELVARYHDALRAHGVHDYDTAHCWRDYRRHAVNGLFMTMFSAVNVARTPRGDDMFATMARRHARHALELDAFALW